MGLPKSFRNTTYPNSQIILTSHTITLPTDNYALDKMLIINIHKAFNLGHTVHEWGHTNKLTS